MRRLTKLFAVALVLTLVLVMSIAGTAFAGNNPDSTGKGKQAETCNCSGECVCGGECIENAYSHNYDNSYDWSGAKGKGPHQEQQKGKPEPLP